jgi:hypothetical protein
MRHYLPEVYVGCDVGERGAARLEGGVRLPVTTSAAVASSLNRSRFRPGSTWSRTRT